MQCVTTPLFVVKCVDLIQVCVASGCAWQAWSQNLSEEVASIPAFPPRRMVKPTRMPIPMRVISLRLGPTFLRPEIMCLYSAVSFCPRRGGRGGAGRTSQKAKRKVQKAKVKPQERLSWIIVVVAAALPFAFCPLPFDLFFPMPGTKAHHGHFPWPFLRRLQRISKASRVTGLIRQAGRPYALPRSSRT